MKVDCTDSRFGPRNVELCRTYPLYYFCWYESIFSVEDRRFNPCENNVATSKRNFSTSYVFPLFLMDTNNLPFFFFNVC